MIQITGVEMASAVFTENKEFADSGTIIEVTGNNDGPELDRIESVWGLRNEPYCAMGAYWAFAKTYAVKNGISFTDDNAPVVFAALRNRIAAEWLHFDPLVANMKRLNQVSGNWREYQQESDVHRMVHGDYVLFSFPTGHHIGQFDKFDGENMWLVEWNSTAAHAVGGNSNDPGNGGGCYYKSRPLNSFIWGWIPWTYGK